MRRSHEAPLPSEQASPTLGPLYVPRNVLVLVRVVLGNSHCMHLVWFFAVTLSSIWVARAENWPSWRGPRGDGTSLEKNIPVHWSTTSNVCWKTEIPGIGHASPVVWGDRLFVVSAVDNDRVLVSLDRQTGKILWQRLVITTPLEKKHTLNSHASSTPATDGELVYVSFLDRDEMVVAA